MAEINLLNQNPMIYTSANYEKCIQRLRTNWPVFMEKRKDRLIQANRFGAMEKVSENILEDLFTTALDWDLTDINNQVKYADIGSTMK